MNRTVWMEFKWWTEGLLRMSRTSSKWYFLKSRKSTSSSSGNWKIKISHSLSTSLSFLVHLFVKESISLSDSTLEWEAKVWLHFLIKTFFISKLAALRIALDGITSKRRNSYRSHHTSSETTDLATLRDIYVELAALRSYCDLNQTGFYKIIKKYDKTMEVRVRVLPYIIIFDYSLLLDHCTRVHNRFFIAPYHCYSMD